MLIVEAHPFLVNPPPPWGKHKMSKVGRVLKPRSSIKDETDTDPDSSKCSAGSSTNQTETCGSCSDNGHGSSNDSFIQQLFLICDQDGDGFISSADLLKVLDDMGLEEVVDVNQILDEMGGTKDGRISYDQFVQCLISVRGDIEQVQVFNRSDDCMPENSNNMQSLAFQQPHCSDAESQGYSTFGTNSHSYCSGEIDSGARDCSPERYTNTKKEEQHTDCDVLLNFANKLHMAALVSLRNEVQLLQSKLRQSDIEIRRLNEILIMTENENAKTTSQLEDSLESQAMHYEERITELHSILAEVHKKSASLRDRDNLIIEEEEEDDESPENVLATKKAEVSKKYSGGPLISQSVTNRHEGPLMEDVLIRQAHVSKVVPRVNKPPPPPRATATKTAVQKSLELEIERLKSSQKNVSALNDVLCLNLEESRTQCEKFFTLLLKYESAVGTQQLVIDASHKLCDAYEYLVRLLDVKNTLASSSLLGGSDGIQSCLNCRSNSIQSCSSSDSRPDAKELFSRLNGSADSRFLEKKLRLLISKLDEERKSYDGLISISEIPVESLADESKFGTTASTTDQNKEDVEMKALIQEMMSLKEERAELRCRLFDYERKEESRVVPKYFPGLTTCLQDLVEADKMNPDSNLKVKISQLSQLIRSSALAYQSKEDELNQTISKMKHMLKFLLQLIGRQKRGSQFELQTLEELLQKCPL